MAEIILYSIGCPKCDILKKKLDDAHIAYELCADRDEMERLGIKTLPVLKVNSNYLNFYDSLKMIKEVTEITERKIAVEEQ